MHAASGGGRASHCRDQHKERVISRDRTLPWSREKAAVDYFRRRGGLSRPKRSAAREGVLQACSSPATRASIAMIRGRAPGPLRPFIDQILVLCPSEDAGIKSYAESLGAQSRIVRVSRSYGLLQGLFSSALSEFSIDFRRYLRMRLAASDKSIVQVDEAVGLISQYAESFAVSYEFSSVLELTRALIAQLVADPLADRAVASRWAMIGDYRGDHLEFADADIDFTLAHEMAHHLLNHTRRGHKDELAPGPDVLGDWLAGIGYQLPAGRNRDHRQEFEADALAALIILGPRESADAYDRAVHAVKGAFCALPALQFKEGLEVAAPTALDGRLKDTHPTLEDRAKNLLEILLRAAADHPDGPYLDPYLGRPVSRHPSGLALGLWACQAAMPLLTLPPLWTPRIRLFPGRG